MSNTCLTQLLYLKLAGHRKKMSSISITNKGKQSLMKLGMDYQYGIGLLNNITSDILAFPWSEPNFAHSKMICL